MILFLSLLLGLFKAKHNEELLALRRRLDEELKHRERLEEEVRTLREQLTVLSDEGEEVCFVSLSSV